MTESLLAGSKLKNILKENLSLADRSLRKGKLISYKGRKYGWLVLKEDAVYLSSIKIMNDLKIINIYLNL